MATTPINEVHASSVQAQTISNNVPAIITCSVVFGVAALNICALRLYARLTLRKKLVADDWFHVVATCLLVTYDICFGLNARYDEDLNKTASRMLSILSIINDNLYAACTLAVKLSLLTLYNATFSSRNFRRCILLIAVYTAAWAVAVVVVTNVRCLPINYTWDQHLSSGRCLAYDQFVVATTGLNVVGSFAILVIPVPMVLRLSLSSRKQKIVILTFSVGGATCAVGIIRFIFSLNGTAKASQGTHNLRFNIISSIDLVLGLLCSSLPIYSFFFPGFNTPCPNNNSRRYYMHNDTSNFRPQDPGSISTRITGGQTLGPRRSGIAVTDDLSRTTHTNVGGAWVRVPNEDEAALFPMKVYKGAHRYKSSGWTDESEGAD